MTLEQFLPLIYIIVAAITVILAYKSSGLTNKSNVTTEVMQAYKTQVEQLKEQRIEDQKQRTAEFQSFTSQISALTLKIGKQEGIIQEKDKQIERLQAIVENRDPELKKVLDDLTKWMKDTHEVMARIDGRTIREEERSKLVDQGHVAAAAKVA